MNNLATAKLGSAWNWGHTISAIKKLLNSLTVWDQSAARVCRNAAFDKWCDLALAVYERRGSVFLVGNGASATMASHFAADLFKNVRLKTEVFTDPALITAFANDVSFEEVFAMPLMEKMEQNDILIAISSSGESQNVLRAAEAAGRLGGTVITLSAMSHDNSLRTRGNLNFYIPAATYGMAESCHATILHHWMDLVSETVAAGLYAEKAKNFFDNCIAGQFQPQ